MESGTDRPGYDIVLSRGEALIVARILLKVVMASDRTEKAPARLYVDLNNLDRTEAKILLNRINQRLGRAAK